MKPAAIIRRSLIWYRRTHLGVILGSAVATTILVGALAVGDSVRFSLNRLTALRLGTTEYALAAGDRFVRAHVDRESLVWMVSADGRSPKFGAVAGIAGRGKRTHVHGIDHRLVECTVAAVAALGPDDG